MQPTKSKSIQQPTNISIDSNQLLSLCQRIRDNMGSLEKSHAVVQLRLITLSYIHEDIEDPSLKCFDDLIELCNLSQLVVQLLDELREKLENQEANSIHYQVASQQLMFFASEWYDNFVPKLNETFELASRHQDEAGPQWALERDKQQQRLQQQRLQQQQQQQQRQPAGSAINNHQWAASSISQSSDVRVREALLRLKQSMNENERLIAAITANLEYTRTTIEAIHDSLEATKLGLNAGQQNAVEAIKVMRQTNRWRILCYACLVGVVVLIIYSLLRALMIL